VQVNWGWLRFKQGHYAEAEQVLLKVLPHTPRGHIEGDLAWVYEAESKFGQAEATLRQWVQRSPENPDACNELAELLANRGEKLDEALLLANRAVEAIPGNAAYLKSLGWVYFQRHEWDAAEKPLQEAIQRAGRTPTRAIARELLRTVQDKKGNLRKRG